MKVNSPVLKYYGSKFLLAQWIISFFPQHKHYVEPFGGAANVLLVKEPSFLETYNDLNDKLVNFFQVLREKPDELLHQIELTPWARTEFVRCLEEIDEIEPIEIARRLYARLQMSFSGQYHSDKGSWRRYTNGKRLINPITRKENFLNAAKRLAEVQIENRDAFKLIQELDSPETLFYLDPPYIFSTRTTKNAYSHEMDNDKHKEFAELLYKLQGFVILSGYPSKIYEDLFENKGWVKVTRPARILSGKTKTEALWLSPNTQNAISC